MGLVAAVARAEKPAEWRAVVIWRSHTVDELHWALAATRTPPHVSKQQERQHVDREYRRIHTLLKDIDAARRHATIQE